MTKPTLLVLAAGMGSRYGGLKQIDPVGPAGETIIDYSVFDAIRAGFGRLVFVVRRDIERPFKETIGRRFEDKLPVDYVFQELDKVPPGFVVPPSRAKPWGTAHAILMGADVINGPFAAINGDDFYGRASYHALAQHLASPEPDLAMVGFVLENTLSEFGSVARGVCQTTPDGYLKSVVELTRIERGNNGGIQHTDGVGQVHALTGKEWVSLNMWGFTPGLFDVLREQFAAFLKLQAQDPKAEFFIPSVINQLVQERATKVKVLNTPSSWFGVTYKEDRPRVLESIRKLMAAGEYPSPLWQNC
jgi:NDP-sugar pyrophosphorylase family protein